MNIGYVTLLAAGPAGLGVSSHQYFCALRFKNIVWLLPGLACPYAMLGTWLRLSSPDAGKAVCLLRPYNFSLCSNLQARRDLNPQPSVLETDTLAS